MQRLSLVVLFLIGLMHTVSAEIYRGQLWKSDSGSTMKFNSIDRRGNFQGTFTNYSTNTPCVGIPYPVSGWNGGPQVNFTVNFAKCRATKTWRGNTLGDAMTVGWGMSYIDQNGKPATTNGFEAFFVVQQRR